MTDLTHLDALNLRLSHERGYLAAAKTSGEIEMRKVWIAGIEKEISHEMDFLGIGAEIECDMTDEELLAALGE